MSKIWFTSDLHFFHKNIVRFTDRKNVITQEEHTEWLIDLWNSTVAPEDEIYSLGDFAFTGNFEKMADLIGRLNGKKYFILGNHCENKVWNKIRAARNSDERLKDVQLVDRFYTKSFLIGEKKEMFVFCHFSLRVWWNQHHGSFHVFGHSHGSLVTEDRSMDVGIDAAYNVFGEHRFFTLEEVHDILSKKPIISGDYHDSEVN